MNNYDRTPIPKEREDTSAALLARFVSCGILLADHAESADSEYRCDNSGRERAVEWMRELVKEYHDQRASKSIP